jgi:long-chain acyl-CoA synthetase
MMERPWFKHWPEGVPRNLTYPKGTLDTLLRSAAKDYPDCPATDFNGEIITYGRLDSMVDSFAGGLQAIGVVKGDRVSPLMTNCPQAVLTYFGVLRAGGIVVQADPMLSRSELVALYNSTGTKTVVTLDFLMGKVLRIRDEACLSSIVITDAAKWLPRMEQPLFQEKKKLLGERLGGGADIVIPREPWMYSLEEMMHGTPRHPVNVGAKHDDVAVLQFTGGTTGTPKCAMLTHENLTANACQTAAWLPDARLGKEVFLSLVPFSHSYGLTTAMLAPIRLAALMVMRLNHTVSVSTGELAEATGATIFPGVPAHFEAFVRNPAARSDDISSIRVCISGSAPLPPDVRRRFEEITGVHLVEGYGLTEASPVTHCNPFFGLAKDCIGIPYPDTDAKIVDVEIGLAEMPVGEVGELAVRGPQVMKGYFNKPDETALVKRGDWLLTGDIALMDADGYFHVIDRKKDMLICGGLKVYPRELEKVILEHSAVEECAVVGIPDLQRGAVPVAFVVLKKGSEDLDDEVITFTDERVAVWKRPIYYSFLLALPKTPAGKVLKTNLREQVIRSRTMRGGTSQSHSVRPA